jgi:hypothetical protein
MVLGGSFWTWGVLLRPQMQNDLSERLLISLCSGESGDLGLPHTVRLEFESLFLCRTMRVWGITDCPGVLGGGSHREHLVADQAEAQVLIENAECLVYWSLRFI